MESSLLLDNFELLAETVGSVTKLRELVLHIAMRGELFPRDGLGGAAIELTNRLVNAREKLVREGILKGSADLLPVTAAEIPFAIPESWSWVRIGEVMRLFNGKPFKPTEWSTRGLPIVRIQNLNNANAPFNYCDFPVDEKFHIHPEDFLISWSGTPGTSFGAFIWGGKKAVLNQHIFRADLIGDLYDKRFLRLAVNVRLDDMIAQAHGGVGLQHITKGKLENLCIPLASVEEQHRIVAKVDQLLALCDEMEARQQAQADLRTRLTRSAWSSVTTATTPGDFATAWQRIAGEFDLLHATPESVADLRSRSHAMHFRFAVRESPRPTRSNLRKQRRYRQRKRRKTISKPN